MSDNGVDFAIRPTQIPKKDDNLQDTRDAEAPSADGNIGTGLPQTVPLPNVVTGADLLPDSLSEVRSVTSQILECQDEDESERKERVQNLQEIGDAAKEFLKMKREKFEQMTVLQEHRYREMLVFSVFLVLVCVVAMLARSTLSSSMQTSSMHNFLAEEGHSSSNKSNVKLNLAGQGAFDDVREWLQSVFYRRIYSGSGGASYYSDGSARLLPILGNNMILGSVQVRQLRLKTLNVGSTDECKVPAMIARLNPSCYPHFSIQNEETGVLSDYLALWETQNGRNSSQAELPWAWWTPHSSSFQSTNIYSHFGVDYPNGGYIVKMPKDPEAGRLALANLYLDQAPLGWLKDNNTAALLTEWVVYNPNNDLFYLYTTLFENRHAGGIPSETFRTINLARFNSDTETAAVAGVEVCLFAYILFYIIIEARNINRLGFRAWVTDGYSLLMVAIICLFLVVVAIEIVLFLATAEVFASKNFQTVEIRDLSYIMYYTQVVLDVYSVIVLLSWFRLGKYLDVISPKTKMLSETVARSAPDIAYFLILFFCVFMGFVTAFQTGFGDRIMAFRNFKQSCVGTFRAVLEDFDYDEFKAANSILGPIIIVFFIFVTIFLLVEMFLGIVMANYEEVLDDLGKEEEDLPSHMRLVLKKRAQKLSHNFLSCIQKNKVMPEPVQQQTLNIQQTLKFYEDSKEIFQAAGFKSAAEVKEVVDGSDGGITIEEIRAFAKMHEKGKNEEAKVASTIASLKRILSVTDKIEQELQNMKSSILL